MEAHALIEMGTTAQAAIFFAALLLLGLLELIVPLRLGRLRCAGRWRTNWSLALLNLAVMTAVPLSFVGAAQIAAEHGIGLLNWIALPEGAVIIVSLLGRAFVSFATHWCFHHVPLLWRLHRVHHLDTELDISSTLRFHPIESLITPWFGLPLIFALGPAAWVLALYELLDAGITVFTHANLRLPSWLERAMRWLIVTPGLHRVHHSTLPAETNSNFGAVLPIWDQFFGTYRTATSERPQTMALGLAELRTPEAQQLTTLLRSPFRRGGSTRAASR